MTQTNNTLQKLQDAAEARYDARMSECCGCWDDCDCEDQASYALEEELDAIDGSSQRETDYLAEMTKDAFLAGGLTLTFGR
tara:strand:+ start:289 stop:531 length:243 start_codon:yes stop_codon:yes gene_type:complete